MTLQSLSLPMGILGSLDQEKAENIELTKAQGGAETNSFSKLAAREDGTNIFSKSSFPIGILSLKRRFSTLQLCSFQFLWVALLLGTYCFSMSFSNLNDQFNKISFQSFSEQLCNMSLESLNQQSSLQLDFDKIELDAVELGSQSFRTQLQQQRFQQDQLTQQHLLKPADQDRIDSLKRRNLSEKQLDKISFEFIKKNHSAYSKQLQQLQFSNQNSNKKLDSRSASFREKEVVEKLVNSNLLVNQLQRNLFEAEKHKKINKTELDQQEQLPEQAVQHRQLRHLQSQQLLQQDATKPKQLPKEACFASGPLRSRCNNSFSKKKLLRWDLSRSTSQMQLKRVQSEQLLAAQLTTRSFHRNRQIQNQLVHHSFIQKMEKKLPREQPDRVCSNMSLKQLSFLAYLFQGELPQLSAWRMKSTLQSLALGLSLRSFQLTTAALLLATLVALSYINFEHQSFQLSLRQLCFVLPQGGELAKRACRLFRQYPAWTLCSLNFDAWLKHSDPKSSTRSLGTLAFNRTAWKQGTCRRPFTTSSFSQGALKRRSCTKAFSRRRAWRRTTSSLASLRRTTYRTTFSQLSTTPCTSRTSSLRSTPLLSMFLLSLVSSSNYSSSNSFSCTRDLELVKPRCLQMLGHQIFLPRILIQQLGVLESLESKRFRMTKPKLYNKFSFSNFRFFRNSLSSRSRANSLQST